MYSDLCVHRVESGQTFQGKRIKRLNSSNEDFQNLRVLVKQIRLRVAELVSEFNHVLGIDLNSLCYATELGDGGRV